MVEMIGTGTWSEEGGLITVIVTSMPMNGESMDIPENTRYVFAYNGCELVQVVTDENGDALYYPVYSEQ